MKKLAIQMGVLLIGLLVISQPAWAGWVLLEQDGQKNLISQGRIKTVPPDATEGWSVMDFKKGQILIVNFEDKTYAQASLDQFCKSMQQLKTKIQAMLSKTKQPPKPLKVEVIKQGAGGKIAGVNTEKYKVMMDGQLYEEVWLTTELEFIKDFNPAVLTKLMTCGTGDEDVENSPAYQKMVASGWLLRAIDYEGGQADTQTDVVKITKQDIAESEFAVPQGLKKTSIENMIMGQ